MKTLLLILLLAAVPAFAQEDPVIMVSCAAPSLVGVPGALDVAGWRVIRSDAGVVIAEHTGESATCPTLVRIEVEGRQLRAFFVRPVTVNRTALTFGDVTSAVTNPLVSALKQACAK